MALVWPSEPTDRTNDWPWDRWIERVQRMRGSWGGEEMVKSLFCRPGDLGDLGGVLEFLGMGIGEEGVDGWIHQE